MASKRNEMSKSEMRLLGPSATAEFLTGGGKITVKSSDEAMPPKQIVKDLIAKQKNSEDVEHILKIVKKLALSEEEQRALSTPPKSRPIKYFPTCEICGKQFTASRNDKMTCEEYRCRKQFYRLSKKGAWTTKQVY